MEKRAAGRRADHSTIKRSTYSSAGQTVAIRVNGDPVSTNNGLFYLLSDHLGSTSLLVNSSGGTVAGSATRYLPFGGYRTTPSQTITDLGFTGQKENMEVGLLYYNARFYVPGIGRFASADTIVPNPASPQSFNRYSYVNNSPLNFIDPTGHISCQALGTEDCVADSNGNPTDDYIDTGSSRPIPPPPQMVPTYVPTQKFTTWPIDPTSPGYSTQLQGFGDTQFAWKGLDSYYRQTGRLHSAIDIFVERGASVVSVGSGHVVCVACGISNPVAGVTDPGIGIYHDLCKCVTYYTHMSSYAVQEQDDVEAGTPLGLSGTGFGVDHLHLEIRSYQGSAEFRNPLYYFDTELIADLSSIPFK